MLPSYLRFERETFSLSFTGSPSKWHTRAYKLMNKNWAPLPSLSFIRLDAQKRKKETQKLFFLSLTRRKEIFGRDPVEEQVGVGVQMLHAATLRFKGRHVVPHLARLFGTVDRRVRNDIRREDGPQHLLGRHARHWGERRRSPPSIVARIGLTVDRTNEGDGKQEGPYGRQAIHLKYKTTGRIFIWRENVSNAPPSSNF